MAVKAMRWFVGLGMVLSAVGALGQGSLVGVTGDCSIGGNQVILSGLPSSGTQPIGTTNVSPNAGVLASYPNCTVNVYYTGTTTHIPIFADNLVSPDPLGNPFTANNDGSWTFFVPPSACVDVVMSTGTGPPMPYVRTRADVCGPSSAGSGVTFETNSSLNGSQTTLNLIAGTNIGLVNSGGNTTISASSGIPGYEVAKYGAVGNGTTDDTTALNNALAACPQTSPNVGCDIYLQGTSGTIFKASGTLNIGLLKGVHLHGVGTVGTGGCTTVIQTNGAYDGLVIGTGVNPDSTGFEIDNVCFQDMTGTGTSGVHIEAIRDGMLFNVGMIQYFAGAGFLLDGGSNFTQFITIISPYVWQTKYPIQESNPTASTFKTASNYVLGGELNCQNSGLTDVIPGSIGVDIGYARQVAGTGTGSESWINTQIQNCQVGVGIWDGGGNKIVGKALEYTSVPRGSGSIGVAITGDTPSLANGNILDKVQVRNAGTGIYIGPNTANTVVDSPIFTGTNAVDYVTDLGSEGSTNRRVTKRLTGLPANFTSIARSGGVVTGVTNGADSIYPGTLIQVFGVTGGTTPFNGTFSATCTTNNTANTSTCTWSQAGANESGMVNAGGCAGVGSCMQPLSTGQNAGVGQVEITGDNTTEDVTLQVPFIPTNGSLPLTTPAGTTKIYADGVATDIIENNNGVVHITDQGANVFTGGQSQFYTPQPAIETGGFGTVNCAGTGPSTCTWNSGYYFGLTWTGTVIINNTTTCPISSVSSLTSMTVSCNTGTLTGVNYNTSGVAGIPACTAPLGNVCTSSDDKKHIVLTNTNGSTLCLPPLTTAGAYPQHFGFWVEFEPGGSDPNYFSITPPGGTSLYSIGCLGAAALFRGLPTNKNLSGNQGVYVYNNGTNWFADSGAPDVHIDQLLNGVSSASTNLNPLTSGSFTGGGTGANNGQDWFEEAGSSNSSGARAGDRSISGGPDSASGTMGDTGLDQYFESGTGLGGKNGFIVKVCPDVAGTACPTVPAGNSGAVRLTVSGTDLGGAVGIVLSGAGQGSPSKIRFAGVYGHNLTDGAVVETSCSAGQYYAIAASGSLDNGAGECDAADSSRRVGIALLETTGTCGQSSPCHVPILIMPAAGATQNVLIGLSSGLVLQSGKTGSCPSGSPGCTVTFTHTFSSAPLSCTISGLGGSVDIHAEPTTTTLQIDSSGVSDVHWQCIGAY